MNFPQRARKEHMKMNVTEKELLKSGVADLMVSHEEGIDQNTDKPDITIVSGLRLLLDKAANVDEAIELLSQYDMHFSLGRAQPYALSLGEKDWCKKGE